MHPEAKIYIGYVIVGGALTAYAFDKLLALIERTLSPVDVALVTVAIIALLALSAFYAVVAFAFAARFIDQVKNEGNGVVLCRPNGASIQVNGNVRVIRRFGKQFSSNENKPAFVLFIANGQLWVRPQEKA